MLYNGGVSSGERGEKGEERKRGGGGGRWTEALWVGGSINGLEKCLACLFLLL